MASEGYGPLYVQKPFYPEGSDLAHCYILHPPGGVVSGDHLQVNITLNKNCQALFTTPGAGRVYKARADKRPQTQINRITTHANATAEWLPLETIIYPHARGRITTRIELAENAHFIGWDICSLGLPASGQEFDKGSLHQRLEIFHTGTPRFIDAFDIGDNDSALRLNTAGLAQKSCTGLLVAGPFEHDETEHRALLQSLRTISERSGMLGITAVNGFICARYLGDSANEARACFTDIWQKLRPILLHRPACPPRIWSC